MTSSIHPGQPGMAEDKHRAGGQWVLRPALSPLSICPYNSTQQPCRAGSWERALRTDLPFLACH